VAKEDTEVASAHMRATRARCIMNAYKLQDLDMYSLRVHKTHMRILYLGFALTALSVVGVTEGIGIAWQCVFGFGAMSTFMIMWFEVFELLFLKRKIKILQESLKYDRPNADNTCTKR